MVCLIKSWIYISKPTKGHNWTRWLRKRSGWGGGGIPRQQTKELYPPQETFSNGKRLNKHTRVYLMKFLWLHSIPVWALRVISGIISKGRIFEDGCSFGKVVKKTGCVLLEISLVCNYVMCYARHLIYWVGVAEGTNGQRAFGNGIKLPNHAALRRSRRDTIR